MMTQDMLHDHPIYNTRFFERNRNDEDYFNGLVQLLEDYKTFMRRKYAFKLGTKISLNENVMLHMILIFVVVHIPVILGFAMTWADVMTIGTAIVFGVLQFLAYKSLIVFMANILSVLEYWKLTDLVNENLL